MRMTPSKLLESIPPGQLPMSVNKTLLHAGQGPYPEYKEDSKVIFNFQTRIVETGELVDDTRTMKNPMELLLGKQFKLEIWETMLKTMSIGEVAKFTVPKSFVVSYPMVSKALRESQLPKSEKKEHHCCGMINQGCGYPDLDKLLQGPADLEFTFEILEVKAPGGFEKEAWEMSEQEKFNSIPLLKVEGNVLFKNSDIKGALAKYHEAIARLEQLALREKPGGPESQEYDKQKVPLLLNYALCLMKSEDYYGAIEHFTTVLKIEPENVKGLFRRAKCHAVVGNNDEATADFERAIKLDSNLTSTVAEELKKLSLEEKAHRQEAQKVYQKMFQS